VTPRRSARAQIVWVALGLGLVATVGCGQILGVEEGRPEGDSCEVDADCTPGRVCVFDVCTDTCSSDASCGSGQRCVQGDFGTACVGDASALCADGSPCPAGTECSDGACRTPCGEGVGTCLPDQVCLEGFCVGTDPDHDSAAPGGTGGAGAAGGGPGVGGMVDTGGTGFGGGEPAGGGSGIAGSAGHAGTTNAGAGGQGAGAAGAAGLGGFAGQAGEGGTALAGTAGYAGATGGSDVVGGAAGLGGSAGSGVINPATAGVCERCRSDADCVDDRICAEIEPGRRVCLTRCGVALPNCPLGFMCEYTTPPDRACIPPALVCCVDDDEDSYGDGMDCLAPDCDDSNARCALDCSDADEDEFCIDQDNCPDVYNPTQANNDLALEIAAAEEPRGDACDDDDDNDEVNDAADNCPLVANLDQQNSDFDEEDPATFPGDACQDDADGDTIPNDDDNCPQVPNTDQLDTDGDDEGDACDDDDELTRRATSSTTTARGPPTMATCRACVRILTPPPLRRRPAPTAAVPCSNATVATATSMGISARGASAHHSRLKQNRTTPAARPSTGGQCTTTIPATTSP